MWMRTNIRIKVWNFKSKKIKGRWKIDFRDGVCAPTCSSLSCGINEECLNDNDPTCTCQKGYNRIIENDACMPTCEILKCGQHEICNEKLQKCECDLGYEAFKGSCRPTCAILTCGENEICDENLSQCVCQTGYRASEFGCEATCAVIECGKNQICNEQIDQCECAQGYALNSLGTFCEVVNAVENIFLQIFCKI